MTTKIEEVARAIWNDDATWELMSSGARQACSAMASRAIEAMREPTPKMLRPLWSCCAIDEADAVLGASASWQLAIDAALNEGGAP